MPREEPHKSLDFCGAFLQAHSSTGCAPAHWLTNGVGTLQRTRHQTLNGRQHNTLQHSATHCNTLQHSATHCNTLQHSATLCNTLQRSATLCNSLQKNVRQYTAYQRAHYGEFELQHSLQHTLQHALNARVHNIWIIRMSHVTHMNESCHTYE